MTRESSLGDRFNRLADSLTVALGSLPALVGSVVLVVIWALTGPIFNFSDTWQLFINTTTTVVTFWMVFVIQNSANRASKATQLKLDEIIRALDDARNEFISLDTAPEQVLVEHEKEFVDIANGHEVEAPVVKREKTAIRRSGSNGGKKTAKTEAHREVKTTHRRTTGRSRSRTS
jgi:low affinity Fe/Cu permease